MYRYKLDKKYRTNDLYLAIDEVAENKRQRTMIFDVLRKMGIDSMEKFNKVCHNPLFIQKLKDKTNMGVKSVNLVKKMADIEITKNWFDNNDLYLALGTVTNNVNLQTRVFNLLYRSGITSVDKLNEAASSETFFDDFRDHYGVGWASVNLVRSYLELDPYERTYTYIFRTTSHENYKKVAEFCNRLK